MKLSTKLASVALSGVATFGFASGAWAYFTAAGGTAEGAASVGTVNSPADVIAASNEPGLGLVNLGWNTPAPSGLAVSGYYVERLAGGTSTAVCASSPTSLLPAGSVSCDDFGVAPGTYAYRVTAVYGTMTAASADVPVTVVGDGSTS